jgi:hypothetical protein
VVGSYPVRFLSVLAEAFDNIINARYPGLVKARLVLVERELRGK